MCSVMRRCDAGKVSLSPQRGGQGHPGWIRVCPSLHPSLKRLLFADCYRVSLHNNQTVQPVCAWCCSSSSPRQRTEHWTQTLLTSCRSRLKDLSCFFREQSLFILFCVNPHAVGPPVRSSVDVITQVSEVFRRLWLVVRQAADWGMSSQNLKCSVMEPAMLLMSSPLDSKSSSHSGDSKLSLISVWRPLLTFLCVTRQPMDKTETRWWSDLPSVWGEKALYPSLRLD